MHTTVVASFPVSTVNVLHVGSTSGNEALTVVSATHVNFDESEVSNSIT